MLRGVAYPERILAPGEDVVARLHPHAATVVWAVVRLLSVVGVASFAMALVPAGPDQAIVRLAVLGLAVAVVLVAVAVPLLRWWTSLVVVTTHRLLHRSGVLGRRGQDVGLAEVCGVSFSQTPGQRLLRSGTLRVALDGERALELEQVPGVERLQSLLHHMMAEDEERRLRPGGGLPLPGSGGTTDPLPDVRGSVVHEHGLTDLLR